MIWLSEGYGPEKEGCRLTRNSVRTCYIMAFGSETTCRRERFYHTYVLTTHDAPNRTGRWASADPISVVANKTDLCSDEPPELPNVQFGQAVHIDHSPSPPSPPSPTGSSNSTPKPPPTTTTRTDLRPRAVTATEGAMFAKEHNLLYVETSAKEGWHVVDAFEWTAREVLASVSRSELDRRKVSLSSPVQVHPKSRSGGCG